MSIKIPIDVFFFIIPLFLFWLWSLRFSSQKTGGGGWFPASSERDGFWFLAAPGWLIFSLALWAIYSRFFR